MVELHYLVDINCIVCFQLIAESGESTESRSMSASVPSQEQVQ